MELISSSKILSLKGRLDVFKEEVYTFNNLKEINFFCENVENKKHTKDVVEVILNNFHNNEIFRFADVATKNKIKEILQENKIERKIEKEELYKIFLYFYDYNLLRKIEPNLVMSEDLFYKYIIQNYRNLFKGENSKFPKNISKDFLLGKYVVDRALKENRMSYVEDWIMSIYGKDKILEEMPEVVRKQIEKNIPDELKSFLAFNNIKYKKINVVKERKKNQCFFVNVQNGKIIQLSKRGKEFKYNLINQSEYSKIVEKNSYKIPDKKLNQLRSEMKKSGYEMRLEKIIKKIVITSLGIGVTLALIYIIYFIFSKLNLNFPFLGGRK